ncbi:MAG: nucleotidyltransferase [Nitrospira sp.]|nr:nucleotidyltransferase [Nitrospira sp.]
MLNPNFRDILSTFNAEGVDYLLVGAYAVAAHGLPRATGDIDLWIRATPENARRAWDALALFGAPTDQFSLTDLESPEVVIQIGVSPERIDVLTSIDGVDFDTGWRDRVAFEVDGLKVQTLSRQHLIASKRSAGRPQDLADAARLSEMR